MVIRVRRLLSHPSLPQGMPTDQSAPEREERLVDVGALVVADTEASELVEPSKRSLDDPAPDSQTAAMRGPTHRHQRARYDAPGDPVESRSHRSPDRRPHSPAAAAVVLGFRAVEELHPLRPAPSRESFRFAPVRRTASGTPWPSQIRWRLVPRLALSVGFGPVSAPPHVARTEQLSTTARDQSIWSWRASQSNSAKCISPQNTGVLPIAQPPPACHP